jgi:hypothetical protein
MGQRLLAAAGNIAAAIARAFRWWFSQINRQDTLQGKAIVACVGLLVICVACSIPVSLVNGPRKPVPAAAVVSTVRPPNVDAAAPTQAPTSAPEPTEAPSATPSPTKAPTATALPTATSSPIPTATRAVVGGSQKIVADSQGATNTAAPATNTPKPTAKPVAPKPIAPKPKPKPTAIPAPVNGVRVGAICRDGSRSSATGRGACSHHGGVATWLYR